MEHQRLTWVPGSRFQFSQHRGTKMRIKDVEGAAAAGFFWFLVSFTFTSTPQLLSFLENQRKMPIIESKRQLMDWVRFLLLLCVFI